MRQIYMNALDKVYGLIQSEAFCLELIYRSGKLSRCETAAQQVIYLEGILNLTRLADKIEKRLEKNHTNVIHVDFRTKTRKVA